MKTLVFRNGDAMPLVGLGTWKSEPGDVYAAVREAIRLGYRHIDCALLYGNEPEIGSALRDAIAAGEVTREQLWITSKLWNNAHHRQDVEPTLRTSLRDLGLNYLDLYLIHWPIAQKPEAVLPASGADFLTADEAPLQATWAAMEDTVRAGLTRHIGVSNFSVHKLRSLTEHCTITPEMNQVELHPFLQQTALVDYCASEGILMTAYSPLGSADRPPFLRAEQEPSLLENDVIQSIAGARHCTPAQVLIAWHVHRGISVIPKSIKPARLRENLAAAEVALTSEDMKQIAGLDRNFRYLSGSIWVMEGGPWTLQTIWDDGGAAFE